MRHPERRHDYQTRAAMAMLADDVRAALIYLPPIRVQFILRAAREQIQNECVTATEKQRREA